MTLAINNLYGSWESSTPPFTSKYGVFSGTGITNKYGVLQDPYGNIFSPSELFATGAPGLWYDLSLTDGTLFQDAAGTLPVTAVEQPVGLVKDKSGRNNHAFQTTSANRPVLSARYNLLTYTEDFSNAEWRKANATIDSVKVAAPNGTLTGQKLIEGSAVGAAYISCLAPIVIGTAYTYSCYAKSDGSDRLLRLAYESGALTGGAVFDLQAGTVYSTEAGTASISAANGGWYLCTWAQTASSTNNGRVLVQVSNPQQSGTSGIYIWGADFRPANDGVGLPPYQRVNTATDYDTVGFPLYLRFNGSTQFLQTNSIDFSSTDKVLVAAGARWLNEAASGMIAGFSTDPITVNGSFGLGAIVGAGLRVYSKGTILRFATASAALPSPFVVTGIAGISDDRCDLRLNSVLSGSSAGDQGTGNYGSHSLYVGSNGGTSLFFNGRLYSLIIAGIKPTDAQILGVETYINRLTRAF